jgi:hypothetical protein
MWTFENGQREDGFWVSHSQKLPSGSSQFARRGEFTLSEASHEMQFKKVE